MEATGPFTLDDINHIPSPARKKIQKFISEFTETQDARQVAENRLREYVDQVENMKTTKRDLEVKLQSSQENINELRRQLDLVSTERTDLLNKTDEYEKQISALRRQNHDLVDERDILANRGERLSQRIETLQQENKTLELQFKSAVESKCEALARLDEVESKETVLTLREKNLEQDRTLLNARIQSLTDEVQHLQYEITNSRREFSAQILNLESRLNDKTLELKTAQRECSAYQKRNDELNATLQELSEKIRSDKEQFAKMAEGYLKEIETKDKVIEIYNKDIRMDTNAHNELASVIEKQKKLLIEQANILDSKETELKALYLKYEQDMEDKDKQLSELKDELKNMNEALKKAEDDNLESTIAKIAPTAAITCHSIRFNMTLTELYTAYIKAKEEINQQKSLYAQLKIDFDAVISECKEKYPEAEKQRREFEKLVENFKILEDHNMSLKGALDDSDAKVQALASEIEKMNHQLKREKMTVIDLNRQICFLLKENQTLRTGMIDEEAEFRESAYMVATSEDAISSKFVSFNSIQDLMDKNTKLLALVRELSDQTEKYEELKHDFESAGYQQKLEMYEKKFETLTTSINKKNELLAMYVRRCEYLKKILLTGKKVSGIDNPEEMDNFDFDAQQTDSPIGGKRRRKALDSDDGDDGGSENAAQSLRIQQLEQQIDMLKERCKTLKEEHDYYVKEKNNNDRLMLEEAEANREKIRELTSSNCRLMSDIDFHKSQAQIQLKNIAGFKKQIEILEERTKQNEKVIIKYEHNLTVMHEEMNKAHRKEAGLEIEVKNLRQENYLIKESLAQLKAERESVISTMHNQKLLLNNLELIRNNMERSDNEGRERAERRLDDCLRETTALRRTLKEKEEHFEDLVKGIKQDKEKAVQRLKEEQQEVEKLRAELTSAREDIKTKAKEIEDISKKLQESLSPNRVDNPVTTANKRAREFELKLQKSELQVEALQSQLQQVNELSEEYKRIAESTEHNLKELSDKFNADVNQYQAQLKQFETKELEYKSRISELEAEVQLSSIAEAPADSGNDKNEQKLQNDLSSALQNLSACQKEIRKLRVQNVSLEESLSNTNSKLINEMNARSLELQELGNIKNEYNKLRDQVNDLIAERDTFKLQNSKLESSQDEKMEGLRKQHEELKQRFDELSEVNDSLHNQVGLLSERLSVLSHTQNATGNDSLMDTSTSSNTAGTAGDLNRSQTGESAPTANTDELLKIIKFLRKEKDILVSKLDIMNVEKARLMSEQKMLQREVDNLKAELEKERTSDERKSLSTKKYEEMLEKLDDIKSLKDSNRLIREERDGMAHRLTELNDRIRELEEELFPLKNNQRDLNVKIDDLTAENSSLRTEAMKWRQRANILVEKSNRNPEEFKRLQTERESLAKMLTSEKDITRQLNDELSALRNEKVRLDTENKNLQRQLQALNEENEKEKKKATDEFASQKQNNTRLYQEVMEMRNKLLQKDDDAQQMQKDLDGKESVIADLKTKEIQLRKIAKRYKDQFLELQNKLAAQVTDETEEGRAAALASSGSDQMETGDASVGAGSSAAAAELLQQRNEVERLNTEMRTMQEEFERLSRDNDTLRLSSDEHLQKLREAKSHIASLTESKSALVQELTAIKSKLQNTATQDAIIRAQSDDALARLSRENEQLNVRIMQLNRQLGLQQTAKPSTSSVTMAEKSGHLESSPRTANVKPMSGSGGSVQQSATVTPWRGGETPLASIRPISVQNSRTAAILPTSQQSSSAGSSTSSSGSSTTSTSSSSPVVGTPSSAGCSNTALVPPQQVHTTGNTSVESMSMSSSPTSSHTDYMPSTSSAAVAVAAIPPMGSTSSSASIAESSQEAESVQQQQQANESSQLHVSGGQQQVVALVSPRVEGSSQTTSSPNLQLQPDANNQQQQPSTSGTTSGSTSHIASVSSHSRHTQPSSSNVTTSQAGTSAGHKRARDHEGDSSTSAEEIGSERNPNLQVKRLRTPMHETEAATAIVAGITADADIEYQVPTSSQRDQEDDVVLVDSEADEEDDGMAEADDGPADAEQEGYEDSYEQGEDIDENDTEANDESLMRGDDEEDGEIENVDEEDVDDDNEVDIGEGNQAQCSSAGANSVAVDLDQRQQSSDNQQQQSQAISSGSGNIFSDAVGVSTPQAGPYNVVHDEQNARASGVIDNTKIDESASQNLVESKDSASTNQDVAEDVNPGCSDKLQAPPSGSSASAIIEIDEPDVEYIEDPVNLSENVENAASQSEMHPAREQGDANFEDNADGVSSEGEKAPAVGGNDLSEEGREAEASTTETVKTRSRARGTSLLRRPIRDYPRSASPRGGGRITPIVWQPDQQGNMRGFGGHRPPRAARSRGRRNNYGGGSPHY